MITAEDIFGDLLGSACFLNKKSSTDGSSSKFLLLRRMEIIQGSDLVRNKIMYTIELTIIENIKEHNK